MFAVKPTPLRFMADIFNNVAENVEPRHEFKTGWYVMDVRVANHPQDEGVPSSRKTNGSRPKIQPARFLLQKTI
ncbi:hypothetical protein EYF80_039661 [Liparis tanakae]|uniref:Uncharacterized protein n=1 Tax=Liparis tanakae TaxID=230148 RepID=A0A4Z2G996_9TELE|nr:hypothetical protein EYF80_039661 [Liparis tanakae]